MLCLFFVFNSFSAMAEETVPCEPANIPKLKSSIVDAIKAGQYFYIGAASAFGTPMQSMRHREGSKCTPKATKCNQASRHRADKRAKDKGLHCVKIYLSNKLTVKKKVCKLEKELIEKYTEDEEQPLCVNEKPGRANCIKAEKGIVYVRIYEKKKR